MKSSAIEETSNKSKEKDSLILGTKDEIHRITLNE